MIRPLSRVAAGALTVLALSAASAEAADRYIVQLDASQGKATQRRAAIDRAIDARGGNVLRAFDRALNAVVISVPEGTDPTLLRILGAGRISPDAVVTTQATQTGATWGLDRVDQGSLPLSTSYTYNRAGADVTAYIIDTGILTSHADFGGRATVGFDALGGNGQDCNGHGTHVAGTVGGTAYGIAKAASLVGVRTLDCNGSGTISQIIAGIDWVIGNHAAGAPAVANMSLGGSTNSALDTAVGNLIADGVSTAVAAGNSSAEACSASPARVPAAITVAASDKTDKFASFSNRGSCVDVIAPGVDVVSEGITSSTATATLSGTSMASPHVAGVAARLLAAAPASTPAQIASQITSTAITGKVTSIPRSCTLVVFNCKVTTPNRLLQAAPTL